MCVFIHPELGPWTGALIRNEKKRRNRSQYTSIACFANISIELLETAFMINSLKTVGHFYDPFAILASQPASQPAQLSKARIFRPSSIFRPSYSDSIFRFLGNNQILYHPLRTYANVS